MKGFLLPTGSREVQNALCCEHIWPASFGPRSTVGDARGTRQRPQAFRISCVEGNDVGVVVPCALEQSFGARFCRQSFVHFGTGCVPGKSVRTPTDPAVGGAPLLGSRNSKAKRSRSAITAIAPKMPTKGEPLRNTSSDRRIVFVLLVIATTLVNTNSPPLRLLHSPACSLETTQALACSDSLQSARPLSRACAARIVSPPARRIFAPTRLRPLFGLAIARSIDGHLIVLGSERTLLHFGLDGSVP